MKNATTIIDSLLADWVDGKVDNPDKYLNMLKWHAHQTIEAVHRKYFLGYDNNRQRLNILDEFDRIFFGLEEEKHTQLCPSCFERIPAPDKAEVERLRKELKKWIML